MDNYAPTCDNKHRNCLKCLNCIVNYNRIKKHFKNIRLKYVCYIQHDDEDKTPIKHTNIKMSLSNWNVYRYYNTAFLNEYSTNNNNINNETIKSLTDNGKYLFTKDESNKRLQGINTHKHSNELFNSLFVNNSILPQDDAGHIKFDASSLSEAVYNFVKANIAVMRADAIIIEFIKSISDEITQNAFFGMLKFYKENKHVSIFTIKQQTIFYKTFTKKTELLDEFSTKNTDYFKWKTSEKLSYKIVATFKNCFTWSKLDDDTINIQFLDSFVECYVENKIYSFITSCSRGTTFNYLLLPHCTDSYKLLKTLFKYKHAIPIFRSKCISIHEFIAFLKPYSVDIFQRIKHNTTSNILNCTCSKQKKLVQFMNETIGSAKPKKLKRKKSKNKTSLSAPSQVIDISDISYNTVIETDVLSDNTDIILDNNNITDSDSDSDSDENINQIVDTIIEPTALVKYANYPYVITFYRYEYIPIPEQDKITFMINECYTTDEYFRDFIKQYTVIRVVQSFHYDYSQKYNSLHFNVIFETSQYSKKSPVYHCYIQNNRICSMTTIINILQRK